MTEIELKPCPFCGGEAKVKKTRQGYCVEAYSVICENIKCRGNAKKYVRNMNTAIDDWNRRAEDERH